MARGWGPAPLLEDGVYARDGAGRLRFWRDRSGAPADLPALLARRVDRLLARRGVSCGPETDGGADGWTDDAPVLAGLAAASVQGVGALGARAGVPTRRWGDGIDLRDFEVRENGTVQQVLNLSEISIPPPENGRAAWTREIGEDIASNDLAGRRLVVIVLDDSLMGVRFGEPVSARQVAHAIIDQLGPADLAAIVYTLQGRAQPFTTDRRKLRSAVDALKPHGMSGMTRACGSRPGGCLTSTLLNLVANLRDAPPGRKMVMIISPTPSFPEPFFRRDAASLDGLNLNLVEMFRDLQRTNTVVYGFDPQGLTVARQLPNEVGLAELTGGRTVRLRNDPEQVVPDIFEQNSSYYLLGYRSTHTRADGRFRDLRVAVARPDVEVRTRRGYAGESATTIGRAPAVPEPLNVQDGLAAGLPATAFPLRAALAAFAAPGGQ